MLAIAGSSRVLRRGRAHQLDGAVGYNESDQAVDALAIERADGIGIVSVEPRQRALRDVGGESAGAVTVSGHVGIAASTFWLYQFACAHFGSTTVRTSVLGFLVYFSVLYVF